MDTKKNIEVLTESFLSKGLTAQEEVNLQHILENPENKAYFKNAYLIWDAMNHVNQKEVEGALQKTLFRINQPAGRKKWFLEFGRIAAAILIIFVSSALLYLLFNDEAAPRSVAFTKVTVPLGSKSQIELPDGTVVTLNAGSQLHYKTNFGEDTRDVWLEGEGYFKVTKNEAIPFVVRVKDVAIKALGTEFNVKAYPDEKMIQTTLVNGLVSIRQENAVTAVREYTLQPKQIVTIFETEIAAVDKQTIQPVAKNNDKAKDIPVAVNNASDFILENNVKTELYTSWKEPRWVIESEQLGELVMKMQRRYNVRIVIVDEELKKYPFTGILTDETLEQVLDIITSIAPIKYSINKKDVRLAINPSQRKFFETSMKR